jgi:2-keto-4-pentenoate hydratase
METGELRNLAEEFRNARISKKPIQAPSERFPNLDVKAAMEVQRHTVDLALENGDRVVGYKLGNIAKAMQEAFGVDEPDYGYLMASSFLYEGAKVPLKNYIHAFVELEPAFVLKAPLKGPNATVADVISAIDYTVPAVEIIDSRVKDWTITLEDTLADSGSNGAVILGGSPRRVTDIDLGHVRGHLKFNGEEIMSGSTRAILGNPFAAVAWLVNHLAEFDISFRAGQVILPGSCLRAMPMDKPGRWSCTYDNWGTIEFDVI